MASFFYIYNIYLFTCQKKKKKKSTIKINLLLLVSSVSKKALQLALMNTYVHNSSIVFYLVVILIFACHKQVIDHTIVFHTMHLKKYVPWLSYCKSLIIDRCGKWTYITFSCKGPNPITTFIRSKLWRD